MTTLGPDEAAPLPYREVEELRRVLADTKAQLEELRAENERFRSGQCVDALIARIKSAEAQLEQLRTEAEKQRVYVEQLEAVNAESWIERDSLRAEWERCEAALVAARTEAIEWFLQQPAPIGEDYAERHPGDGWRCTVDMSYCGDMLSDACSCCQERVLAEMAGASTPSTPEDTDG